MRLNSKADRAAYRAVMIPKGAERDPRSSDLGEAFKYDQAGKPYAIAFWGSAGRPLFHYSYRKAEDRDKRIDEFFASLTSNAAYKAKQAAERKASGRGLEVGDILLSSWGYDQTNIDYYEVTKLIGEKQVEIRMIGAQVEQTGWLCGQSVPAPGKFIGEPMVKLARNGSVNVRGFASAHKMSPVAEVAGKKTYRSSYWSAYA